MLCTRSRKVSRMSMTAEVIVRLWRSARWGEEMCPEAKSRKWEEKNFVMRR